MAASWFVGFQAAPHRLGDIELFARTGGNPAGPPLLLLHGYPQTHAMWHRVAMALAPRFSLVIPDLRGYGDSTKPPPAATPELDHAQHSKRAMAADMAALMASLGHDRFGVVGHDRGGRVAHRLALDHPERIERLAVVDIVPTLDMYEATEMRFASAYYHWFFLIQPAPLPERLIGADPAFYLRWTLGGWGSRDSPPRSLRSLPPEGVHDAPAAARRSSPAFIEAEALAEYERCFCRAEAIHAACEDYRASASIDLEHDRASRAAGEKIRCDLLVLWGERGVVGRLFDPLSAWRAQCAGTVSGEAVDAGHFIPEERPDDTAARIEAFFSSP
jgi:haloacetate dehalogenase